jgi:large subunit ribosomal protein L9
MKVILMENIETLGTAGTVKDVANGYARNFLLPRGMAVPASAEALKRLERQRAAIERRAATVADEARGMAERLAATTVYIYAKSGEQNRLYGSVTTADIATALANQHGLTIDRHNISLAEPIHRLGNYTANVKLASGASGKLNVTVDNEANRGKPRPEAATAAPTAIAEATSASEAAAAEATPAAESAPLANAAVETAPAAEATIAEDAPAAEATIAETAPVAEASITEAAPAEATIAEDAPAAEAMTTMTEDTVTLTPHPSVEVVETADKEVASNAGESSAAAIAAATPAEPDAPVTEAQEAAAQEAETGLEGDAS